MAHLARPLSTLCRGWPCEGTRSQIDGRVVCAREKDLIVGQIRTVVVFVRQPHNEAEKENGCDVPDMNPINTVTQHALRLCDEAAAAERPTCFKVRPSSHWANELKHVDTIYDQLTKEEIAEWREAFELFSAPEGRRSALEHWLKHELQDTAWMLDGAVGQALLIQAEAEADSRHAPTQLGRSLLIIRARRQAKRAPASAASADYEHTGVSVQYPGSESCHSAYPWGLPRPPAILCCDRLLAPRFWRGG